MRRFIITLMMAVLCPLLMATTYYVAPDGDDQQVGTSIDQPFATIVRAIGMVQPGDTILVREGHYLLDGRVKISDSGEPSMMIRLWAYPGERPFLDFSGMPEGSTDRGIQIGARYWHIRGFEIANARDNGVIIDGGHFNIIQDCIFRNNGDTGLQISGGSAYNEVINCDSYFNRDATLENADGFAAKLDIGKGNRFVGCRAWNNADDGWDLYEGQEPVEIHYCWAFRSGYLEDGSPAVPNGDMNGFKLGGNYVAADHIITHSIAFHNGAKGFDQNHNTGDVTLLNNTSWMNGTYYTKPNFNFSTGQNIFKNNISFMTADTDRLSSGISEHNSWEGFTVDSSDFISLDTSLAIMERQPDWNLPEIDLLRPAPGSDLIDAGVETGAPFAGAAPDLGAWDSDESTGFVPRITLVTARSALGITAPLSGIFPKGDSLTVEALPSEGYLFKEWNGDIQGGENPVRLMAEANIYLEPVFMEDTSSASRVDDTTADAQLKLYPNPAIQEVRIQLSSTITGTGMLYITDLLGKTVYAQTVDSEQMKAGIELDVSQLSPGIYIAGFDSMGRRWYCKFIRDQDD